MTTIKITVDEHISKQGFICLGCDHVEPEDSAGDECPKCGLEYGLAPMLEVEAEIEITSVNNDGIGSYEYWGTRGFDAGTDYIEEFEITSITATPAKNVRVVDEWSGRHKIKVKYLDDALPLAKHPNLEAWLRAEVDSHVTQNNSKILKDQAKEAKDEYLSSLADDPEYRQSHFGGY